MDDATLFDATAETPKCRDARRDTALISFLLSVLSSASRRLGGCIYISIFLALFVFGSSARAELRTLTTTHYRIQTDLERTFADDLAHRMDVMYDEYARRLVEFSPPKGNRAFDVFIFQRREDYLKYTNNRFPNTGGVFISGKALAGFLEGQGRDQLRRTMQHEAFHQFAFSAIGPEIPVWLNEGLAQVFEEGIYDGQSFRIGQVPPRRIRQLQSDMEQKRLFEFRSFLSLTSEQWAGNLADKSRASVQYNQAWAMAHFLIFAEDRPGKPRFRSRLIDMLRFIHTGKSGDDAFTAAFSNNFAGFQTTFLDYARTLQPTLAATYIEHQDILADMLIELDTRGKRFTTISEFRREVERGRYRVEYTRGSLKWTSESDPQKYFHDLENKDMGSDRLFLDVKSGAPLPDIVSQPVPSLRLRTRFTQLGGKMEHEILVEAPR